LCPSGDGGERWMETTSKLGAGVTGEVAALGVCAMAESGTRSAGASRIEARNMGVDLAMIKSGLSNPD